MEASRTVLDVEDNSRTKNCGLGLKKVWPWPRRLGLQSLATDVRCAMKLC